MGNTLDTPALDKDSHQFRMGADASLQVGVSGIQGWRNSMEDTHLCIDIPSFPDHTLLAVFDGHGGKETANCAMLNLLRVLEENEKWRAYIEDPEWDQHPELLGQALLQSFIALDNEMAQSKNPAYVRSGCAALVCVITPSNIICANAGDCRAVVGTLCNSEIPDDIAQAEIKHINLSEDHKPTLPTERARIEAAGTVVNFGRVNGDLSLSRGFGDLRFKGKAAMAPHEQAVTCCPDISIYKRDLVNDFALLLACDGLYDVISSEQAVRRLMDIIALGETSSMLIAEEMIDGAWIEGKSRDNITAIVCIFPTGSELIGRASSRDEAIGVAGIRTERRLAGSLPPEYDIYDNVKFTPKIDPAPGSMFSSCPDD